MEQIIIESVKAKSPTPETVEVNFSLTGAFHRTLTYIIKSDRLCELAGSMGNVGLEPAIMAVMVKAMIDGYNIVSQIPVDPVFLSNMKLYQKRMKAESPQHPPTGWEGYESEVNAWKRKLHYVEVKAEEAPMLGQTDRHKVGAMCSGGVDSLYTLMGVHEIDSVILLENMNFPNVERSLNVLGLLRPDVDIYRVEAADFYHNQHDTTMWLRLNHASFLASAALLFEKVFTTMVTSGTDRGPGFEIGSGHDADYLWSTSYMRFFSYGNVPRFKKVEYLGQHPKSDLIFKHMQVCSDPNQRGTLTNCSRCWKCLFTMLLIDACGLKDKATAFDFTDFPTNFKINFVDWPYNIDYSFLHNMPYVIEAYEKQNNTVMLNLCREYMRMESRIPWQARPYRER